VAVTPLAFFPVPPASPGGGIPDHPPLKGKGHASPNGSVMSLAEVRMGRAIA